ncbi:unnamed protein product [Phytophthora lilii]|uniref:RxLR effector protein n=1 Tax=Phytophthora lilii TaxID=2077276 RepID=A0A9W6U478_9STRA|nr:unnamed protein product [Phytophthora lilii]
MRLRNIPLSNDPSAPYYYPISLPVQCSDTSTCSAIGSYHGTTCTKLTRWSKQHSLSNKPSSTKVRQTIPSLRSGYVVLLAVATLITSTESKSTSTNTLITSQDTHNSRDIEEEGTPAQHHLRTTNTRAEEEQEERGGFKDIVQGYREGEKVSQVRQVNFWR